jgi:hypothetical protein
MRLQDDGENCIMRSYIICTLHAYVVRMGKPKIIRWFGQAERIGRMRNTNKMLVGKPEGKSPLRRPRRRWEDNIKMNLVETSVSVSQTTCATSQKTAIFWIHMAEDRYRWRSLVNTVMNLRVP